MLGDVDPLHDFINSTRRYCKDWSGWICSYILRPCSALIEAPFRTSLSKLFAEGENNVNLMVSMDPIDVLSSDSEHETEVGMEKETSLPTRSASSASSRKLPLWASSSASSSKGYTGSSSGRLVNLNGKLQAHPSSSNRENSFNPDTALINGSADSSYTDIYDKGFRKLSSEQPLKRTLPPSFQTSTSTSTSTSGAKTFMENGGGGLISGRGNHPYQSVATDTTDRKFNPKSKLETDNDEVIMYDKRGNRLLPSSLTQGKSLHSSRPPFASNPTYHSGVEPSGSRLLPPTLMHGKLPYNPHFALPSDPTHRVEEMPPEIDERLIYQAALQNLSQPKLEATLPDGLLAVPLLKHQKIALAWMYQKETTTLHCLGGILADDQGLGKTISTIALILLQRHLLQSRPTSDDLPSVKTEALNLDDDDDNGDFELDKVKIIEETDVKRVPKVSTALRASPKGRPAAGTLVVCPASVLRQWARELDEKVTHDAKLSVLIYHGGTRTKDPVELAKYEVVLTTYAIVTNEVPKQPLVDDDEDDQRDGEKYGLSSEFSVNKKRKKKSNATKKGKKGRKGLDSLSIDSDSGTLAKVGWFRVVLDEAQTIKNHRTQVARACSGLRAKRRWCLSGTPIQNAIDDLYSYFRFLRYDPYSVYQCFTSSIKYPISRNSINGYKKLQAVLKTIMLRRTKGTLLDGEPIINLPTKTICLVNVDFSVEERDFYSKLEADSRSQFKAYADAGTVNQNYANILLMLLRLRQACDHPFLVNRHNSDFVGKASVEMARRLPRDMIINLLNLLEDSMAICAVCKDPPEDAVVTMCSHVFCYQCVSEYLAGDDSLCPAHECKEVLGSDVVFSKASLRSCVSDELHSDAASSSEVRDGLSVTQSMYCSSKIRAVLEILEKYCKPKKPISPLGYEGCNGSYDSSEASAAIHSTQAEPPAKAIVFSQWTGMLDLVENLLSPMCIQYRRFDGKMTLASRDKAVKDFNNDPEVTIMLMSLKAGNLGLNLVSASRVVLLDLWWNPTTEDQAIDRAHRIGQTRPVTVSRLTIKGTVEDRILALQEKKREMVASAFGEDPKGGSALRLTAEDLRFLFMGGRV